MVGEAAGNIQPLDAESRGIISVEHPFGDKAYVTPEEGSYLQKEQTAFGERHGLDIVTF